MEQYSLLKLNGEYVKLYVTTNPNLPRLVKNSGSLVVYHDLYYDINSLSNVSNILKQLVYKTNNDSSKQYIKIYNGSANNDLNNSDNEKYKKLVNVFDNPNIDDELKEEPYFSTFNPNNSEQKYKFNNGYISYNYNELTEDKGNYLYLGNELIAGGWGFMNKSQRDLAIKQMLYLPDWINKIQYNLGLEQIYRKKEDNQLYGYFKSYVRKGSNIGASSNDNIKKSIDSNINKQGYLYLSLADFNPEQFHFENSIRNINGKDVEITQEKIIDWAYGDNEEYKPYTQFLLKDLPKLFDNADYKDAEIINIDKKISFLFFTINKDNNKEYAIPEDVALRYNDVYKIDDYDSNIIYAPIGSSIYNIAYNINWKSNDSGGINKLSFNKINSLQPEGNNYIYSDNTNSNSVTSYLPGNYDNPIDMIKIISNHHSDIIESHINIGCFTSEQTYLLKILENNYNQKIEIINNININIGATPPEKYKNYKYLEYKEKTNDGENTDEKFKSYGVGQILKSTQNIIKEHDYQLDNLYIIPKYLIYYSELKQFNLVKLNNDEYKKNLYVDLSFKSGISIKPNKAKIIIDNQISLQLSFNRDVDGEITYHAHVFALPIIYSIDSIILKKENIYKNVTGLYKCYSYIDDYSLDPTNYNKYMTGKYNLYYGIYPYINGKYINEIGEESKIDREIFSGNYELIINISENNSKSSIYINSDTYMTIQGNSDNKIKKIEDKLLNIFDLEFFKNYGKFIFNNDFESNHIVNFNSYNDSKNDDTNNVFVNLLKNFNKNTSLKDITKLYQTKIQSLYF